MGILDSFMKNVRRPKGFIGRLFVKGMNITHHKRTDWGLQHIKVEEDFTILDIGCGGGRTICKLASMAPKGKVYGVDISEDSVEVARNYNKKLVNEGKVDIRHSGVSKLPFDDDFFDLVTAVETHIYWPDLEADLGEALRTIKPDGSLILIGGEYIGSRFDDRNRNWATKIGMSLHTLEELKSIMTNAGFKDVEVFEDYDEGWFCAIGKKSVR
jgi:ubiquinone/menaquinone biosynthesis C-methylase UbiE